MEATSRSGTPKSIQLLQDAIHQLSLIPFPPPLIDFDRQNLTSPTATSCADESLILSNLISQLESLKQDGIIKYSESESSADATVEEESSSAVDGKGKKNEDGVGASGTEAEEVVKELRIVKRQNTVTHWLLSGLIVLTLVHQFSEFSLILKIRDGLNNPFSTMWRWVKGVIRRRQSTIGIDPEKPVASIKDSLVESATQSLKLTNETISQMDLELPRVQLPRLVSGQDKS